MPRIHCQNNPDCYIDCPGSGYAYFEPPYGPCVAGCGSSDAADRLYEALMKLKPGKLLSGSIEGITTGDLADFARRYSKVARPGIEGYLETLGNLDILTVDRRISANWSDADAAGVLAALVRAAGGSRGTAAVA